jgi:hypothetical protein
MIGIAIVFQKDGAPMIRNLPGSARHRSVIAAGRGLLLASGLFAAGSVAMAAAPPFSKPGLWVMTRMQGKQSFQTKMCIDRSTQASLTGMGNSMVKSMCSKMATQVSGSVATTQAVCKMGGSTMTTNTVVTYQGDTAFHAESHTNFSPPFMGKTESQSVQDGKWTGACPAGMVPGDMMGPNGMKMHLGAKGFEPPHR